MISHGAFANLEGQGGSGPWLYLGRFPRCFKAWHFKPTKRIAGDVHLRCHQDRKIGTFLLQLLVPSDLNGSNQKTCKNDDEWVRLPPPPAEAGLL